MTGADDPQAPWLTLMAELTALWADTARDTAGVPPAAAGDAYRRALQRTAELMSRQSQAVMAPGGGFDFAARCLAAACPSQASTDAQRLSRALALLAQALVAHAAAEGVVLAAGTNAAFARVAGRPRPAALGEELGDWVAAMDEAHAKAQLDEAYVAGHVAVVHALCEVTLALRAASAPAWAVFDRPGHDALNALAQRVAALEAQRSSTSTPAASPPKATRLRRAAPAGQKIAPRAPRRGRAKR